MKKETLFLILLLFSILLNGQNLIKGQIVDQYGDEFIAEILINNQKIEVNYETGIFEFETNEQSLEINIKFQFYLNIKYQVELNKKLTDLGKIYLISERFWLDGPKNGVITGEYESGITKYRIELKKWDFNGISEYFNKKGELTQKIIYKRRIPKEIYNRKNGVMKKLDFKFDKRKRKITVPNTVQT